MATEPDHDNGFSDRGAFIPSAEHIRRECAAIQKDWTATERRSRRGQAEQLLTATEVEYRCTDREVWW